MSSVETRVLVRDWDRFDNIRDWLTRVGMRVHPKRWQRNLRKQICVRPLPRLILADQEIIELIADDDGLCEDLRNASRNAAFVILTEDATFRGGLFLERCGIVSAMSRLFVEEFTSGINLFRLELSAKLALETAALNRRLCKLRREQGILDQSDSAFIALDLAGHSRDVLECQRTQELDLLRSLQDDYFALATRIFLDHGSEYVVPQCGDALMVSVANVSRIRAQNCAPLDAAICAALHLHKELGELREKHRLIIDPVRYNKLIRSRLHLDYRFHMGITSDHCYRHYRLDDTAEYIGAGPIRAADLCAADKDCKIYVEAEAIRQCIRFQKSFSRCSTVQVKTKQRDPNTDAKIVCYRLIVDEKIHRAFQSHQCILTS